MVDITVINRNVPPVILATVDTHVTEGDVVRLDSSNSYDDGEIILVNWTQLSGPTIDIRWESNRSTNYNFTAVTDKGKETNIVLQLSLTDDEGAVATKDYSVTVFPNEDHVQANSSGGGHLHYLLAMFALSLILKNKNDRQCFVTA